MNITDEKNNNVKTIHHLREFIKYKDNNGVDKYSSEVSRLVSIRPNKQQQIFNDIKYYNFIHFGINTYTNREWGKGNEDPQNFKLSNFDANKVVLELKESGSQGIIFTAKHHDGFCLWPTLTTEHSIKKSDYQSGKGDLVRELSNACKLHNMLFGIYLSPWDMNSKLYGTNDYNDFYLNQLDELTKNYGDLFVVWLDGACGIASPTFKYDFDAYHSKIRENQPNAAISIMGPDIRWVGNEKGKSRKNEWMVVPKQLLDNYQTLGRKTIAVTDDDLGSRELLSKYDELIWYPAEMDVSIRKGWFYHFLQKPKSALMLVNMYYDSVGNNASLLLNVPLNKKGEIDRKDYKELIIFNETIKKNTSKEVMYKASFGNTILNREVISQVLSSSDSKSIPMLENEYIITLYLEKTCRPREIHLREDIIEGQRIEKMHIYFKIDNSWILIEEVGCIGSLKIIRFNKYVLTDEVKIIVVQSRDNPVIRSVKVYSY